MEAEQEFLTAAAKEERLWGQTKGKVIAVVCLKIVKKEIAVPGLLSILFAPECPNKAP